MEKSNQDPAKQKKISEKKEELFDTPLFNEFVFCNLPNILKYGVECFPNSSRERDMFLLSALTVMSGTIPNCYMIYDERKVFLNLFTMISAPPASGKGSIIHARKYIEKIEKKLNDDYSLKKAMYDLEKNSMQGNNKNIVPSKIKRPIRKRLVIPANSSSAAFITMLDENAGAGIIFETEADTLANILKQEWGNYSDLLRKAYSNEPISVSRKNEDLDIFIPEPKLSVLLSGTPDQVGSMGLINPSNGLQSRFFFYVFEPIPKFKDLSKKKSRRFENVMNHIGDMYSEVNTMISNKKIEFIIPDQLLKLFVSYFDKMLYKYTKQYNVYCSAIVTRGALSAMKIAGILTLLEACESRKDIQDKLYCTGKSLRIALSIASTLIKHSMVIFNFSKNSNADEILRNYLEFYNLLPSDRDFNRTEAVSIGRRVDFSERTIDRRLEKLKKYGFLKSVKAGVYRKIV